MMLPFETVGNRVVYLNHWQIILVQTGDVCRQTQIITAGGLIYTVKHTVEQVCAAVAAADRAAGGAGYVPPGAL